MAGNTVRVYQGKFNKVYPDVMIPALAQENGTASDAENWAQMWVDLERTSYLPTGKHSLSDYLRPLVNWKPGLQNAEDIPYTQGDINGDIWTLSTHTDLNLAEAVSGKPIASEDDITLQKLAFMYLDDSNTLCAVSVAYLRTDPRVFCASIVRNCRAPANERNVYYMVSDSIATQKERMGHPVEGQPVELAEASRNFLDFLGSDELRESMVDLFNERAVDTAVHAQLEAKRQSIAKKVAEEFTGTVLADSSRRRDYATALEQRTLAAGDIGPSASASPDAASSDGTPADTGNQAASSVSTESPAPVIGSETLRIQGNYTTVSNFLGTVYYKDRPENIARDVMRMTYAETPKYTAEAYLSGLNDWVTGASVEDGLRYNQGDLDASHFSNFLPGWITKHHPGSKNREISRLSFAYTDDEGVPCGITLQRWNGTPHWTACIVRNTPAGRANREVEFLCSPEIAATLPRSSQSVTLTRTEPHQAANDFVQTLGSASVAEMLQNFDVFTQTGEPSPHIGELQGDGETGKRFRARAPDFATRIESESSSAVQSRSPDDKNLAEHIDDLAFKSPPTAAAAGSSGFRLNVQTGDNRPQITPVPTPAPSFFERNKFSLPLTIAAGVAAVALFVLAGVFTAGILPTILGVCGIVAGGICLAGAVKVNLNEKEAKMRAKETEPVKGGSTGAIMKGVLSTAAGASNALAGRVEKGKSASPTEHGIAAPSSQMRDRSTVVTPATVAGNPSQPAATPDSTIAPASPITQEKSDSPTMADTAASSSQNSSTSTAATLDRFDDNSSLPAVSTPISTITPARTVEKEESASPTEHGIAARSSQIRDRSTVGTPGTVADNPSQTTAAALRGILKREKQFGERNGTAQKRVRFADDIEDRNKDNPAEPVSSRPGF